MIDFTELSAGKIGTVIRFSDIFTAALAHQLTGMLKISTEEGLTGVSFENGNPIHVSTTNPNDPNLLGHILVELELTPEAAVDAACAVQSQQSANERAILGKILLDFEDVTADGLQQAVLHQTSRRIAELFGLEAASWEVSQDLNPAAKALGFAMQGWPFLLPALKYHASENEMRDVSEALLGKAVKLKGKLPNLDILGFDEADKNLISLIEKPRKPDQLERAIKNRRSVRGVLKLLGLCGNLELLPVKEGIPIASTVRIKVPKSTMPTPQPVAQPQPAEPEQASQRPGTAAKQRPSSAVQRRTVIANNPMAKEVRKMHEKLDSLNYFQMLDVREDTSSREIRLRYTTLAKKFHPDALGPNQPDDVIAMARTVSAKLNDAYACLEDDNSRKKYLSRLHGTGEAQAGQNEGQVESARVKFEMGNSLLRKGDFKRARDYFHFAMANDGNNGIYKAYYAWSIFADRSKKRSDAIDSAYPLMRTAATVCPDHVNVQFYAAKVFQAKGDDERSMAAFERVLELQPGHDGARAGIRSLKTGEKDPDSIEEKPQTAKEKLSKFFKR